MVTALSQHQNNNHEKFHCYRIVTGPEAGPVTADH